MKRVQDFKVKSYHWLNAENYILVLQGDSLETDIKAGSFAELQVPGVPDVFLRRPISILDFNPLDNTLSFYIKAIGKGTRQLGRLFEGDTVSVVYPLGNSFSVIDEGKALIVGGGSGIAPFIQLGRTLKKSNISTTFLIGGRTKNYVFLTEEFSEFGEVYITTEDGSRGEKGLVTHHSVFTGDFDFTKIYTCGPDPMMKAIAKIASERNIDCEASLENMMACGIGACLCCVTPSIEGNKVVCTEGPVFNTKLLGW